MLDKSKAKRNIKNPVTEIYGDLNGKTALITGASSGLGAQFAKTLSAAGCKVILAARRIEKLEALSDEVGDAIVLKMDVSDKKSVKSGFEKLEKLGVKIDICINNAGIAGTDSVFEDHGNFENIIQTNVMGVWYVTHEVAKHMKQNSIAGSIINISSVCGADWPIHNLIAYNASKSAVIQMSKSMVAELGEFNIRINCILPGYFLTPMTEGGFSDDEIREKCETIVPLHFIAEPKELEGLILYLASNDASRYVSGSSFTIDGGISTVRRGGRDL